MDTYLGCLFSFSCPCPPGHPAGRSQDKPKVLCLGFQCHLMFTWDQRAPKVLLWLVPCRALWHLPVAIPPSQELFASCSLQPHHFPLSLQLCLLTFPSAAFPCTQKQRLPCSLFLCLQPVQLPAATTVTSGWLVLPQRACSHHCWWFTGFGAPYKWTEAVTAASWNSPLGLHHRVCTSVSPSQVHCEFLCAPEVSVLTAGAVVASSIWLFYLAVCIYQAHRGWEGLRKLVSMAGFYSPSAWLKKISFSVSTRGLVFASFVSFQMQSQKHRRGCEALEGRKGLLKQLFCPAKKHIVPVWTLQET